MLHRRVNCPRVAVSPLNVSSTVAWGITFWVTGCRNSLPKIPLRAWVNRRSSEWALISIAKKLPLCCSSSWEYFLFLFIFGLPQSQSGWSPCCTKTYQNPQSGQRSKDTRISNSSIRVKLGRVWTFRDSTLCVSFARYCCRFPKVTFWARKQATRNRLSNTTYRKPPVNVRLCCNEPRQLKGKRERHVKTMNNRSVSAQFRLNSTTSRALGLPCPAPAWRQRLCFCIMRWHASLSSFLATLQISKVENYLMDVCGGSTPVQTSFSIASIHFLGRRGKSTWWGWWDG